MKLEIQLDHDIEQLITEFAAAAKTTPDVLVRRILNARFQEMDELLNFAEAYPDGSDEHHEVAGLVREYYGGEYIFREMKRIDPEYRTPEEFLMSLDDAFLEGLMSSLDGNMKASSS